MIFTIKMHWNDFIINCIENDFYYKNALEMIFIIKMHSNVFTIKCIGNEFLL